MMDRKKYDRTLSVLGQTITQATATFEAEQRTMASFYEITKRHQIRLRFIMRTIRHFKQECLDAGMTDEAEILTDTVRPIETVLALTDDLLSSGKHVHH